MSLETISQLQLQVGNSQPNNPIVELVYKNGAKHYYEVDENGKKIHVSGDGILADHGYSAADYQGKPEVIDSDENEASRTTNAEELLEHQEYLDRDIESLLDTYKTVLTDVEAAGLAAFILESPLTTSDQEDHPDVIRIPEHSLKRSEAAKTKATSSPVATIEGDDDFLLPFDGENNTDQNRQEVPIVIVPNTVLRATTAQSIENTNSEISHDQPKKSRRLLKKITQRASLVYIAGKGRIAGAFTKEVENGDRKLDKKKTGIVVALGIVATGIALYAANKSGVDLWPFDQDSSSGDNGNSSSGGESTTENTPQVSMADPDVGLPDKPTTTIESAPESPDTIIETTTPDQVFDHVSVLPGKGFEDTFQQTYNLTDEQAARMYSELAPKLSGLPGTYLENGDVRILNPGELDLSTISDDVRSALENVQ